MDFAFATFVVGLIVAFGCCTHFELNQPCCSLHRKAEMAFEPFVAAYLDLGFRAISALKPSEKFVALVIYPSLEGQQMDFDEGVFRK